MLLQSSKQQTSKPPRIITVTSGKGGAGKTVVAVNLSVAIAANDKKVLLLDADLGIANVDILLGLHPKLNLSDVINGSCGLEDILIDGPHGIKIMPGATEISNQVIHAFNTAPFDTLIVDTTTGIIENVINFIATAQDIITIVGNEPTAIDDACALMKILKINYGINQFRILANMVRDNDEGRAIFEKLAKIAKQYLDVILFYAGAIPFDEKLPRCIQQQAVLVERYPNSVAARAFKGLARQTDNWPLPAETTGYF